MLQSCAKTQNLIFHVRLVGLVPFYLNIITLVIVSTHLRHLTFTWTILTSGTGLAKTNLNCKNNLGSDVR